MIKFEFEGREFEFNGQYAILRAGCYYLGFGTNAGVVERAVYDSYSILRAIVHPVAKYHDFDGVRFKETGEVRAPKRSEWFIGTAGGAINSTVNFRGGEYIILEPVEILPRDNVVPNIGL